MGATPEATPVGFRPPREGTPEYYEWLAETMGRAHAWAWGQAGGGSGTMPDEKRMDELLAPYGM